MDLKSEYVEGFDFREHYVDDLPTDGGFKYDPVTGGPAPAETTNAIAARANELLGDFKSIKRYKK